MLDDARDFADFLETRESAARAYCTGDAAPLLALAADEGPAVFFGPGGGAVTGAAEVRADYETGAASFGPGSRTWFEVLDSGASGGIGFWTGYQHAEVAFTGKPGTVPMTLRITEVFRREPEGWTLVHRHASPAESPD